MQSPSIFMLEQSESKQSLCLAPGESSQNRTKYADLQLTEDQKSFCDDNQISFNTSGSGTSNKELSGV